MASEKRNPSIESDQSDFSRGIRDFGRDDSEAGKFIEVEEEIYLHRRDPEESKHNEAGQHVVTQGDLEFEKMNRTLK